MIPRNVVLKLLKDAGVEKTVAEKHLEVPPDIELGDFAFPCFVLAKEWKKPPQQIAKDLAKKISDDSAVEKVAAVGPYLNFFLKAKSMLQNVLSEIVKTKSKYGSAKSKKKMMIEYSQPNTHKEFHVGHVRNVALGMSLVNLFRFSGYNVVPTNYIGDVGAHVAKSLWCYLKFHKKDKLPENKGKYLGQIYAEATEKVEKDENHKNEISDVLQKLESGDTEMLKLWQQTRQWSLDEFDEIYDFLGAEFEKVYFESKVEKPGKDIVNELLKKGIAEMSEGAVVINLEKQKLNIFLLLKSDGTSLYSTKDLALAKIKHKDFHPDKSIYVVDSRQRMYFQQVFATVKLMGFKEDLFHLSYDFVKLKDGVMSSRKGNIVPFEDLRDTMLKKCVTETKKRRKEWNKEQVASVSKHIAVAAIKFDMLKFDNNKEITFDLDAALDFEGETGPYLQYAHARLCSILRKAKYAPNAKTDVSGLQDPVEKELVQLLSLFPKKVDEATHSYKPSLIARYCLELAQKANEFYHKLHILKGEESLKEARLLLVWSTKMVLQNALTLLGVEALEEM